MKLFKDLKPDTLFLFPGCSEVYRKMDLPGEYCRKCDDHLRPEHKILDINFTAAHIAEYPEKTVEVEEFVTVECDHNIRLDEETLAYVCVNCGMCSGWAGAMGE